MSRLPKQLDLAKMQTTWATKIDPVLSNPTVNNLVLKNLSLLTGINVINHRLARNLQGWKPTRVRAAATFYDLQDSNQTPQLTLVLVSSADVIIDLEVF